MRFYTWNSRLKEWWCTVIYRDIGMPLRIRVGDNLVTVKPERDKRGQVLPVQFGCQNEHHSIEIYPPANIFAVIASPEKGIDPRFLDSLAPRDEVEIRDPRLVVPYDEQLMKEIQKFSSKIGVVNGN